MLVRLTCAGVIIGSASFDPLQGLAYAPLSPTAGYLLISSIARALGRELTERPFWCGREGDFADAMAARWAGGRLAIEDMAGRQIDVGNIVIIETPVAGHRGPVHVVADFRANVARVGAAA